MKQVLFYLFIFSTTIGMAQTKNNPEPQGLNIGDKAPLFEAVTHDNESFVLAESLKKGPVVVLFYRGQWCPICNRHLSNLQDSLDLIRTAGATVVAISPEKPELMKKTAKKTKAEFTLVFDDGYKICNAFDVTFTPDKATKKKYNTFLGADLENAHSDESTRLPVPATFIINQDSEIVWRHFDPNYKNRATASQILKYL